MRTLRTIPTPWTPYTLMFSRDGTRLAIGGGGWYGGGGVLLVDSRSGESRGFASASLPAFSEAAIGPTISGVCFSADDRHLVASTWTSSQRTGPVALFEVVGLELRYVSTVATSSAGQRSSTPTGLLLDGGRLALRNHRAPMERMVTFGQLPRDIDRGPQARHLTSSRLVLVRDEVITGSHGLEGGSPGLVVVPRTGGQVQKHAVNDCPRVTAITTTRRGELVTGGGNGELHVWSREADAWKPRCIRPETRFPPPNFPGLQRQLAWATYGSNSIVGLCGLADGDRAVSVSAGGHLCLFDTGGTVEAWQLPEPGSPRSLAAHPDGGVVAVALKQGGFGSSGLVSLVETAPREILPAWRTPAVLAMARAAEAQRQSSGLFDAATLVVLADALEDAGARAPSVHFRGHDPRLRTCALIEALLGSP